MSLIVSYNASSCGVCWRVHVVVSRDGCRVGVVSERGYGWCVYMQCDNYRFAILSINSSFFSLLGIVLLAYLLRK